MTGTRNHLRTGLRGAGFAACLVTMLAAGAGTAAAQGTVIPTLDCVDIDPETSLVTGYFGYASTHASAVDIPQGDNNFLFPGTSFRGQPTRFEPSIHDREYVTQWNLQQIPELNWFLDGNVVSAGESSPRCDARPVRWRGAWDDNVGYLPNELVFHGGSAWIATGTTAAGSMPGGPNWDLFAAGGEAGARGEQGPQGDSGPQGDAGPQGERGPQGPPGPAGPAGTSAATTPAGTQSGAEVHTSSRTFRFSRLGRRRIVNPNVRRDSAVVIQYVGGGGDEPTSVTDQRDGRFIATGTPGGQFRYVVHNPAPGT